MLQYDIMLTVVSCLYVSLFLFFKCYLFLKDLFLFYVYMYMHIYVPHGGLVSEEPAEGIGFPGIELKTSCKMPELDVGN